MAFYSSLLVMLNPVYIIVTIMTSYNLSQLEILLSRLRTALLTQALT